MGNLLPFLIGDVGTLIKPRIHSHKFLWGRCQRICPQVIPILALVKTSWGSDSRCKSQKFNDTSTSWLKWKFQIFFQSNERLENPQPAAKLWGPATPCNRGPGQQFPLSSASQRCPSFCGVRWVQGKTRPQKLLSWAVKGLDGGGDLASPAGRSWAFLRPGWLAGPSKEQSTLVRKGFQTMSPEGKTKALLQLLMKKTCVCRMGYCVPLWNYFTDVVSLYLLGLTMRKSSSLEFCGCKLWVTRMSYFSQVLCKPQEIT